MRFYMDEEQELTRLRLELWLLVAEEVGRSINGRICETTSIVVMNGVQEVASSNLAAPIEGTVVNRALLRVRG